MRGRAWSLAAVSALFVATALARARVLLSVSTPIGIDGYYYAIEVRALLEDGRLHYPDLPLGFAWLLPFAALTDPIVGVKLGAAVGTAAIVFPLFFLVHRLSGSRAMGVVAAALAAVSTQSFYLSSEFVKQGLGLTLVACFLAALAAAIDEPSRRRCAGALVWLALTLVTHKLAAGVAVCTGSVALGAYVWRSRSCRSCRSSAVLWLFGVVVGSAVCLALGVWLVPRSMFGVQGLSVLSGAFHAHVDGSFATPWRPDGLRRTVHPEVLLGLLAALSLIVHTVMRRSAAGPASASPVALSLVALAVVVGSPWWNVADVEGLGPRVRLVAFLAFAACTALLAGRLLAGRPRARVTAAGVALALALILPPQLRHAGPRVPDPYLQSLRAFADRLGPDSLVVTTQRSLAFMVTWYTRATAQRSMPEQIDAERTFWLLPKADLEPALAAAIERLRAAAARAHASQPQRSEPLVLLEDAAFRQVLSALPADIRGRWSAGPVVRTAR